MKTGSSLKRSGFKKKATKPMKRGTFKARGGFKTKVSSTGQIGGNKGKSKPISKLKKDLWKVFSKYIRQRDNYTCFTCGRKGEGKGMHAGHFVPKSVGGLTLYFHEKNVHCQCYNCNINLSGNQYEYAKRLGLETADYLYSLKGKILKVNPDWYQKKIKDYQLKLEE